MILVQAGKAVTHTLTFLDPNNSNAAVTGKVYADLQGVVLGYYTAAGVRTTVTASDYLVLTEEDATGDAGEYSLTWTPDADLGDRWWFLHFVYPMGTQVFNFQAMYWVADNKHTLKAGDTVFYDMFLSDVNGTGVTGKTLGDFQSANLNSVSIGGTLSDRDSSLSLTEVSGGYYTLSFTPSASQLGVWSLYGTQPTGTLQRDFTETYAILSGAFSDRVQQLVADKIGHAAKNYPDIFIDSLTDAVREYSGMHPDKKYYTFAGDGSSYEVAVSSLTGYVSQWSKIESIEYPAKDVSALNDTTYRDPQFLHESEWIWFDNGQTERITFRTITPNTGENAVICYTALHESDGSTIPDGHLYAVQLLAASYVLDSLANLSIQEQSAAFGVDATLDMQTRHASYSESANLYRTRALEILMRTKRKNAKQVPVSDSPVGSIRRSLTHEPPR